MDKNLLKKVKNYSAVAGTVLATGVSANAQIVYTDIEPDATFTEIDTQYDLDINNDSNIDFSLKMQGFGDFKGIRMQIGAENEVLGTILSSAYFLPLALDANAEIGAEQVEWNGIMNNGLATIAWGDEGNWAAGQTDKYLGLRFKVDENMHYGWVRLDVDTAESLSFTVKDYAYEQTPSKSIKAGDNGTVAVNELNKKSAFTVYPNPAKNSINIETELNDFDLEIIDITGRTILKAKNERMLNLSNFQKGTYIVRITSKKGKISNQRIILK